MKLFNKTSCTMIMTAAVVAVMLCAPVFVISEDSDAKATITTGQAAFWFEAENLTLEQMLKLDTGFGSDACPDTMRGLDFDRDFIDTATYSDLSISEISYMSGYSKEVGDDSFTIIDVEKFSYHIRFTAVSTIDGDVLLTVNDDLMDLVREYGNGALSVGDRFEVDAVYEYTDISKSVSRFIINDDGDAVITEKTSETGAFTRIDDASVEYTKNGDTESKTIGYSYHTGYSSKNSHTYDFLGTDVTSVTGSTVSYVIPEVEKGCMTGSFGFETSDGRSGGYELDIDGDAFRKMASIEIKGTRVIADVRTSVTAEKILATDVFMFSSYAEESELTAFLESIGTVGDDYQHVSDSFDDNISYGESAKSNRLLSVGIGISIVAAILIVSAFIYYRKH